jgi:hypothetical protein
MAQKVALPEAAMAVEREGGVIGNLALKTQAAEPPIGKIEMHLLTQAALGANGEAIADDQDSNHQLRINRGATNLAVEWLQLAAHVTQIKEPVNLAKDVIRRNVLIKTEIVEQPLRCRLRPHHRSALPRKSRRRRNHAAQSQSTPTKSTQSARSRHGESEGGDVGDVRASAAEQEASRRTPSSQIRSLLRTAKIARYCT